MKQKDKQKLKRMERELELLQVRRHLLEEKLLINQLRNVLRTDRKRKVNYIG